MTMISRKDLEVSIAETKELQKTMIQKKYTEGNEKTYEDIIERILDKLSTKRGQSELHPYAHDNSGMKRYMYSPEEFENMKSLLKEGYFIPGGSILSGVTNTGKKSSLSNCYVSSFKDDSIESIFNYMRDAARTYSYRGGVGVDISTLRPADTKVNNSAKTSTGAVSFMPLLSMVNSTIGQLHRRGASLDSIWCWHPDYFRFVWCKAMPEAVFPMDNMSYDRTAKELQKLDISSIDPKVASILSTLAWSGKTPDVDAANISVKFTEEFMCAVKARSTEPIIFKFPDIEADKDFYNERWNGDLNAWIRIGGKIKSYPTSTLICTKKTLPIFDNKTIDYVTINGQVLTKEVSEISTVDWLSELLDRYQVPIRVTFKNPSAYECFRDLAKAAWIRADPGVLFWDRVCDWTTFAHIDPETLTPVSTNPCSEIPGWSGSSCLLGAHVLSKYVRDPWTPNARFDYPKFTENCITATLLMNFFTDYNEPLHPLKEQRDADTYAKRIGIEFTGLADMLSMLNIVYDSHEALQVVRDIMHLKGILEIATSAHLAITNGSCPACNPRKNPQGLRRLVTSDYFINLLDTDNLSQTALNMLDCPMAKTMGISKEYPKETLTASIESYGLRNVAFNTVGPTGTISILANNCSSGIEPVFALFMKRNTRVGDKGSYNICHTPVAEHLLAYMKERNLNEIDASLVKMMYSVKEAYEIDYHSRIAMQEVVQDYCDSSISSTVNLPNSATPEEILEIYLEAWQQGLKGITIFRDGSLNAVLEVMKSDTPKKEEKQIDARSTTPKALTRGDIIEMPTVAYSHRHEVHWEGHKFYIVITVDETGAPMEVFTSNLPSDISVKDGTFNESDYQFKQSLWIGICRLISISLRGGVPVSAIIKQLDKAKNNVTDIMAVIARVLGKYVTSAQSPVIESSDSTMTSSSGYNFQVCPRCGKKTLKVEAGCNTCLTCMYSKCE